MAKKKEEPKMIEGGFNIHLISGEIIEVSYKEDENYDGEVMNNFREAWENNEIWQNSYEAEIKFCGHYLMELDARKVIGISY